MKANGRMGISMLGLSAALAGVACGDDDDGGGTLADRLGVGSICDASDDCLNDEESGIVQECLTQFKGGYCGLEGCTRNTDCPSGSACVNHDDGNSYCFRICVDKAECNRNRTADTEANCSSNVDFADGKASYKACVPPSSG